MITPEGVKPPVKYEVMKDPKTGKPMKVVVR